jgi:hypothetical protein
MIKALIAAAKNQKYHKRSRQAMTMDQVKATNAIAMEMIKNKFNAVSPFFPPARLSRSSSELAQAHKLIK